MDKTPRDSAPTSYERLWDEYARNWDNLDKPGSPQHLGDEWGSAEESKRTFTQFLEPWLRSDAHVLEIGPGGGKYTVMTAPRVASLVALDASAGMLERTANRGREEGIENVTTVKGNGLDLEGIESESMDIVFSFDVFVHLSPVDVYAYLREIHRVLKIGGVGSLTLASILSDGGFAKFVSEVNQHRDFQRGAEQFGYLTPTIGAKFLFSLGFSIVGFSDEINNRDFAVVFRKDS